jgi:hypothetical protein
MTAYLGRYADALKDVGTPFTVRGLFIVARGPSISKLEAYQSARALVHEYVAHSHFMPL